MKQERFPESTQTTLYLLLNPFTLELRVFLSEREATEAALRDNAEQHGHPSMRLWCLEAGLLSYMGQLWKEYGDDWDVSNCWKKGR